MKRVSNNLTYPDFRSLQMAKEAASAHQARTGHETRTVTGMGYFCESCGWNHIALVVSEVCRQSSDK